MTSSKSTSQALILQDQEALKNNNHAAIILASGLSQRLGQAKQLLFKNGEPLICSMINLTLATQPQAIIIVIPDDNPSIASAITELASQHASIYIAMNPTPKMGMAHSLYLGIEALGDLDDSLINRVLIIGVDQVLLDEAHLMALLAGKHSVVSSEYNSWQMIDDRQVEQNSTPAQSTKNIMGLPLVIDCTLLRQWQSKLIGDKGLRQLIRRLPPNQIHAVSNKQLSYDIDTPEQLAYAKQQGWIDE